MAHRMSFYVNDDDLVERLSRVKDEINVSRVCVDAIQAEVERIERKRRYVEYEQRAREYLTSNPFALAVLQLEGLAKSFQAITGDILSFTPAEKQGAKEGWQRGAESVLAVLRTAEKPLLPLDFEGSTDQTADK